MSTTTWTTTHDTIEDAAASIRYYEDELARLARRYPQAEYAGHLAEERDWYREELRRQELRLQRAVNAWIFVGDDIDDARVEDVMPIMATAYGTNWELLADRLANGFMA